MERARLGEWDRSFLGLQPTMGRRSWHRRAALCGRQTGRPSLAETSEPGAVYRTATARPRSLMRRPPRRPALPKRPAELGRDAMQRSHLPQVAPWREAFFQSAPGRLPQVRNLPLPPQGPQNHRPSFPLVPNPSGRNCPLMPLPPPTHHPQMWPRSDIPRQRWALRRDQSQSSQLARVPDRWPISEETHRSRQHRTGIAGLGTGEAEIGQNRIDQDAAQPSRRPLG